MFANDEYLNAHYKRRHPEYYATHIRPKEDSLLNREIGEYVQDLKSQQQNMDQEEMVDQIKEEVIDRFNQNLLSLQQEVSNIRTSEKNQIEGLMQKTQSTLPK